MSTHQSVERARRRGAPRANGKGLTARTTPVGFNEHLAFFDQDGDRRISVGESRLGLERLGFGRLLAAPAALGIQLSLFALARLEGRPAPLTYLELPETGHVRHPDTGFVRQDGSFDEAKLRALFTRYGERFAGDALTVAELVKMVSSAFSAEVRAAGADPWLLPAGAVAALVEWGALLWVSGATREGMPVLEFSDARAFYTDPAFFSHAADRLAQRREQRKGSRLGRLRNGLQTWLI